MPDKKNNTVKHGDFSALAENYSKHRAGYSEAVLSSILGLLEKPVDEVDFADVGAGTGIWTRMVARRKCRSVTAVEPNDEMRRFGIDDSQDYPIQWFAGDGVNTGLPDRSADLLTMASSFHWVDFDAGTKEFHRVLRPGGWFVALWNPRLIEVNPLLVEIENKLREMAPDMKPMSSGRSELVEKMTDRLYESPLFDDIVYICGRNYRLFTPEEYIGVWKSVNDVRHQAGEEIFAKFLAWVERRIDGMETIEATYQTRAWAARCA